MIDGINRVQAHGGTAFYDAIVGSVKSHKDISNNPFWIESTPDSNTLYVINITNSQVISIDTKTNMINADFTAPSGDLQNIVISADQAPVADFSFMGDIIDQKTHFDASKSFSPFGNIVDYSWDFGDGYKENTNLPHIDHVYQSIGHFEVTLVVTNSAGTSLKKVYSSRFMSNNGDINAKKTQSIDIKTLPQKQENSDLFVLWITIGVFFFFLLCALILIQYYNL